MDFAPGAQHLEFRARLTFEENEMIAETSQAAEHNVFVLRQRLAGPDRAPPHPLNDNLVLQQWRTFDLLLAKRRDHV